MTREDAVTTLKDISEMVHKQKEIEKSTLYGILDSNNEPIKALDMAIKALEQEPCDDAISRQAVIEHYNSGEILQCNHVSRNNLLNYIENLPPVTPKPKTGHWKKTGFIDKVICDVCNKRVWDTFTDGVLNFQYCPNCGAKMLPTDSEKER